MLLDTAGLLCCYDASDKRHADAVSLFDGASARITHNYVLAEFVALAEARRMARDSALRFVVDLAQCSEVSVQWVTPQRHRAAMALLLAQPDKQYSLCDAVSFILMREFRLSDALTTDRHFDRAGFRRLVPV